MIISLVDMKTSQVGTVVDIEGGFGATGRIQSMGIRIGKKIKKEGPTYGRGPQTVMIGNLRIAVGFGMASRIMVEVDDNEIR